MHCIGMKIEMLTEIQVLKSWYTFLLTAVGSYSNTWIREGLGGALSKLNFIHESTNQS